MNKLPPIAGLQAGSILVMTAISMMALLGFVFLTYNVTRLYIVKNEMQNGADAATLAGTLCLNRVASGSSDCTAASSTTLNWDQAKKKAGSQLASNTADNLALSDGAFTKTMEAGYWNLQTNAAKGGTGTLSSIQTSLASYDVPAVKVTITKKVAATFFVLPEASITVSSLSVLGYPGSVPAGGLVPLAINKCMFSSKYWDSTTNQPALVKSGDLIGNKDSIGVQQTVGQLWKIRLGVDKNYDGCISGQWTTFDVDGNKTKIENLINTGNTSTLSVGDIIYIQNENSISLYQNLSTKLNVTPTNPGPEIALAVVDISSSNYKGTKPIIAIAGFKITTINTGGKGYIEGNFITNYQIPNSSGVGSTYYGVYTPPRLAQ